MEFYLDRSYISPLTVFRGEDINIFEFFLYQSAPKRDSKHSLQLEDRSDEEKDLLFDKLLLSKDIRETAIVFYDITKFVNKNDPPLEYQQLQLLEIDDEKANFNCNKAFIRPNGSEHHLITLLTRIRNGLAHGRLSNTDNKALFVLEDRGYKNKEFNKTLSMRLVFSIELFAKWREEIIKFQSK